MNDSSGMRASESTAEEVCDLPPANLCKRILMSEYWG